VGSGRDLDTVLAELAGAVVALDAATDPGDRVTLRDELHRLRAEASRLRGSELGSLSDDALRARLARCDRELAAIFAAHFDPSMVGGASGRGGGLDPLQTIRHNRAVDAAGGRGELEAERQALLAELARRSA
jgi:hypothetical protein